MAFNGFPECNVAEEPIVMLYINRPNAGKITEEPGYDSVLL